MPQDDQRTLPALGYTVSSPFGFPVPRGHSGIELLPVFHSGRKEMNKK